MNIPDFLNSKKALSKKNWLWQVYGAMMQDKWWVLNFLLLPACIGIFSLVIAKVFFNFDNYNYFRLSTCIISFLLLVRTSSIVKKLNKIFCLRKQELRITWSQIVLLITIGLFIISFVEFLNPKKDSVESVLLGGVGIVLTWVFQDTIKSVVAFFYLRHNKLLKIDDWIKIPGRQIDGKVKRISLTTVTIENWDTTSSSFPTHILHTDHFQNLQNMLEGKTFGRQMQKTFIIDTGWIHPLTENEVAQIKKQLPSTMQAYVSTDIKVGEQNMTAFRKYIYQMLLNNPKVSHHPRLVVRWLEQVNEGIPLQLYAFITETTLAAYEWEQSKIIEQFIESLTWFGLQLYQSASGFDASNSNVFLSKEPAKYNKEYDE